MTNDRRLEIDETEIHAFVDGHLAPERRRAVMAHLAASPEQTARASDYRSINEALHLTFDEVLHEPLPPRLEVGRYAEAGDRGVAAGGIGHHGAFALRAAAMVALALMSGFAGWSLNDRMTAAPVETEASSFARNAAQAHMLYAPDGRYPVEFGADQEDTLLLWLSERLGTAIHAPDLQTIGYRLVGGRLLPSAGQPAGQLMYEGDAGKRISLYIRGRFTVPPGGLSGWQDDAVRYGGESGGVSMVYWAESALAYALIGQMEPEQLLATARSIQQQLQIPSITPTVPVAPAEQAAKEGAT